MDCRRQRTIVIVQARMGSTRLPGKVLKPLAGKPVLGHVVDRLACCRSIHAVVVATTTEPEDDVIAQWCEDHGVLCFRGASTDVLDRYYQAAKAYGGNVIVRITADCPMVDPQLVDELVNERAEGNYQVYGLSGEFPDGLDCEVFTFPALEAAWRLARLASEREHVTPYLFKHPGQFRIGSAEKFSGLGHLRWTLDEPADLRFLEEVFNRLYRDERNFYAADVLALLDAEPELLEFNRGILRNEGYRRSQEHDYRVPKRSCHECAHLPAH